VLAASLTVFAYVVIAAGRLLCAAAGARDVGPGGEYVLGVLASCLAVYALSAALGLSAAAAFGALAAVVVVLDVVGARKGGAPVDWRALGGFALCAAFTAAWCSGPASAYVTLRTQDVFPMWDDYFFHGAVISQFGDIRAVGRGSIFLADFPASFYHYASYMAAAPLAPMLDLPGLPLAVSVWLPLGFLSVTAGAYVLGERLAGAAGGVAALAAVAILPDASTYGLRNGLFSFHWSVLAVPGSTYAIGASFLSLIFLDQWNKERSGPALALSAVLAVSTILFRAQLFVLFLPAWLATAVFCRKSHGGRNSLIGILLVAGLGAAAVGTNLALAHLAATDPGFWRFSGNALPLFLRQVNSRQEPTAYTDVYAYLTMDHDPLLALAAGIVLVFAAALGAFLILLPAALVLARRRGVLRGIDVFPGFLAFCWLLLMLFAPVPWNGDSTELTHRPFVLVYAAAAIWTLCLALRGLLIRDTRGAQHAGPAALACALLALPALAMNAESMGYPKPHWAQPHAMRRVVSGLRDAAAFLRREAQPGDRFAVAELYSGLAVVGTAAEVCALSGVPAYLARPYLEMIKDRPRKALASARLAALSNVDRQTDYKAATEMLRSLRVQWYVVANGRGPRWDPARRRAAFVAKSVSIYDLSQH